MTMKIANKLIVQTSKVDEQITSKQDKPIASTTKTTRRNSKRIGKITYFAALAVAVAAAALELSPMLRLPKKVSRSSGKKLSRWRNSSPDDDVVMPVVARERSPKT